MDFTTLHNSEVSLVKEYSEAKASIFVGRDELYATLIEQVKNSTAVLLYGDSGIGTSTVLHTLAKENDYNVFCAVGGLIRSNEMFGDVLRFYIRQLEDVLGVPHHKLTTAKECASMLSILSTRLYRRTGKENLFILDEADLLRYETGSFALPAYARFVVSAHNTDLAAFFHAAVIHVPALTNEGAQAVFAAQLKAHGVPVYDELIKECVMRACIHSCTYVNMLAVKLAIAYHEYGKTSVEDMMTAYNELPDALSWNVYLVTTQIGATLTYTMQKGALALITVARHGMTREGIRSIFLTGGLPWSEEEFDSLLKMLASFIFISKDGTIRISSPWLRDQLYMYFGGGTHEIGGQLLEYSKKSDNVAELMHHCRMSNDFAFAAAYLEKAYAEGDEVKLDILCSELLLSTYRNEGSWLIDVIKASNGSAGVRALVLRALERADEGSSQSIIFNRIYRALLS